MKLKSFALSVLSILILFSTDANPTAPQSHALFPVKLQGKWGYIDRTGKLDIQPQFDDARPFSEGLAQVKKGDKWGYIDQNAKLVIATQFETTAPFSNGLALIKMRNLSLRLSLKLLHLFQTDWQGSVRIEDLGILISKGIS